MARKDGMEVIQVIFNIHDQDQNRLFIHAKSKTNSSGYIKRLIERDLSGGFVMTAQSSHQQLIPAEPKELQFDDKEFC